MKKNSIFVKTFIFFLVFTIILVGTLWVVQNTFLPEYYQNQKIKRAESYLEQIRIKKEEQGLGTEFTEFIRDFSERSHGRILIFDKTGDLIVSAGAQLSPRDMRMILDNIRLPSSDESFIYKTDSPRGMINYLVIAHTGTEYYYIYQTPLDAIDDAIAITQGFYLYLFAAGLLIAVIMSWLFARRITNPLVRLTSIAQKMKQLQFDSRWEDPRTDEIGQLGETLNQLTDNLQKAISDLQIELAKEKGLEKMRKEFVARVSHELQTPIAIITGHIEALQDQIPETEEEKERYLKVISSESMHMSQLIRDLLDLSQLESGNYSIEPVTFSLTDLIEERLAHFDLLIREKELFLKKTYDHDQIMIHADPRRMAQVLNNLIHNAVYHSDPGVQMSVSLKKEDGYIVFEICNETEPFTEEELQSIWNAFYKKKESKHTTGIGLAIVRNIIEIHGGTYGARNSHDGLTIYFSLPIK